MLDGKIVDSGVVHAIIIRNDDGGIGFIIDLQRYILLWRILLYL